LTKGVNKRPPVEILSFEKREDIINYIKENPIYKDEMTKMELHAWYLEIHKQLQLTTLIITHSIEEALNLSDRIYILKNRPGQIVSEIKLDWSEDEDKEVQKIVYKRQILAELGLDK